jgi:integrase
VEDRWRKKIKDEHGNTVEVPSAVAGRVTRWRARYVDQSGTEHARHFDRKIDAQKWLGEVTASLVTGTHVAPKTARMTVSEWCDRWLVGYRTRRPRTVANAEYHVKKIKARFGAMPLSAVKPSDVKAWCADMKAQGVADSYVYALYQRLGQLYTDAVHDGIVPRSPCSRRTSPGAAEQRPYVATTAQVWALHDAMPDGIKPAILLGAHAGLRVGEATALRPADVEFIRGMISPAIQWPAEELKTKIAKTPIPIPNELALYLSAALATGNGQTFVTTTLGRPAPPDRVEDAIQRARRAHANPLPAGHPKDCPGCLIPGLPEGFRHHDLRHYYASLLIAAGLDVKTVQARMRHKLATTTLNTYGHLWPDKDESSKAVVATVYAGRESSNGSPAESLRNRSWN